MKMSDRIELSSDVVSREVGSETMLLNLASGTYFGLDPVGARFWQLLEEGRTAVEARDVILNEYDVEPARLARKAKRPGSRGQLPDGHEPMRHEIAE